MRKNKKYLMVHPYYNYLDGEIKRIKKEYALVAGYSSKKEVKDAWEGFQANLLKVSEDCKALKKQLSNAPQSKDALCLNWSQITRKFHSDAMR